jgi:hypothetical protein
MDMPSRILTKKEPKKQKQDQQFFSLKYAGGLHIIALIEEKRGKRPPQYNTPTHLSHPKIST